MCEALEQASKQNLVGKLKPIRSVKADYKLLSFFVVCTTAAINLKLFWFIDVFLQVFFSHIHAVGAHL